MYSVLHEALSRGPVMPVLVIPDISMAAPLAEALASGGLTVFEITLRTECALNAMVVMRDAVPEALIGAGTVTNADRIRQANDFGADFVVSPGTTQMLLNASIEQLPELYTLTITPLPKANPKFYRYSVENLSEIYRASIEHIYPRPTKDSIENL